MAIGFLEGFSGVFAAQCVVLFIGWVWRKFIEPRLDKTHGRISDVIRKRRKK